MPLPSPRLVKLAILLAAAAAGRSLARRDLALHKPVSISSVLLGDPAGVVNGFVEWGSYAVHTKGGAPAWLTIDLEERRPIGDVRVYGRGDGFFTGAAAMVVELSDDGRVFGHTASCDPIVTQASPCSVALGGVPARYVRVRHPTHLVLSEVEVYEAR